MIPSVKTLRKVTSYPHELRKVLECTGHIALGKLLESEKPFGPKSEFGSFTRTNGWIRQCWNRPRFHELKMSMADELCETCGVEYIPAGHNAKSPAIEYCNAGDTYTTTLLYVRGRYRVGCWGDIVERGDYD